MELRESNRIRLNWMSFLLLKIIAPRRTKCSTEKTVSQKNVGRKAPSSLT